MLIRLAALVLLVRRLRVLEKISCRRMCQKTKDYQPGRYRLRYTNAIRQD